MPPALIGSTPIVPPQLHIENDRGVYTNTDLVPKTRKLLHALSSRVWFFLGYKVRLRLNLREYPHSPLTD